MIFKNFMIKLYHFLFKITIFNFIFNQDYSKNFSLINLKNFDLVILDLHYYLCLMKNYLKNFGLKLIFKNRSVD